MHHVRRFVHFKNRKEIIHFKKIETKNYTTLKKKLFLNEPGNKANKVNGMPLHLLH